MQPLILLGLLTSGALAGADGDGFTVLDGDCNDYDPLTYPGAPEICDGIDNNCDVTGVIAIQLMALGNGNDGEGLTWNGSDGLWYHTSGISNGSQYLEPIDMSTMTVLPNLAVGNTYGPDPAGELIGIAWVPYLNAYFVKDLGGDVYHVDTLGNFTNLNVGGGGGGGSGWAPGPPQARGFAVVGGEVFGVANYNNILYSFDPATGAENYTLPITIDGLPGQGCHALATDPTDGQVWGICNDPGYYYGDRILISIDVTTGVAQSHGSTGNRMSGLGIDDTGRMLAVSGDGGSPSETLYELMLTGGGGPQPGELDLDGDGFLECEECNDNQAGVYPGAPEVCDHFDSDCDGVLPADEADDDGDGAAICDGDCDDNDPSLSPFHPEACDGQDNDCDGLPGADEVDTDGDSELACRDCDDTDPNVNHSATEVCDGVDTDCDGSIPMAERTDDDGDGSPWCADCDDLDANNAPDQAEVCDGGDNDCDGSPEPDEVDADGDGVMACEGDCDDNDPTALPGGVEIAGDGIDQDCDGADLPGGGPGTGTGGGGGGGDDKGGCGCSTQPGPAGLLPWALPLALIGLRRRSS